MTPRSSIARLADDAPVAKTLGDVFDEKLSQAMYEVEASIKDRVLLRCPEHTPVASADSWPARMPPSHGIKTKPINCAREQMALALKAQAKRTARAMIKDRARDYALRPRELDALHPKLSTISITRLVEALALEVKDPQWHRWFGFGGEIPAINLKAAMWYARWSRAIASRNARREA